jgi:hypothetical protein
MPRHLALVATLAFAAPAIAAPSSFHSVNVTEPSTPGLTVTGPLARYRATATARVVVPTRWQRRSARAGRLRFAVRQNSACHYEVSYRVSSAIAPAGSAADLVARGLPARGPRYVLDSGQHGDAAFRVVRQKSAGGQVRLDALWMSVLTRRADIAPRGTVAWARISVTARSRKGDECHAGTWRESLGPDIGDSLAVSRAKLRFTAPKR